MEGRQAMVDVNELGFLTTNRSYGDCSESLHAPYGYYIDVCTTCLDLD
jgi:hypothetical protein